MQGAIRSMSISTREASSMGTGTVNVFSSCTAGPPSVCGPGTTPEGGPTASSRAGTCGDRNETATLRRSACPHRTSDHGDDDGADGAVGGDVGGVHDRSVPDRSVATSL